MPYDLEYAKQRQARLNQRGAGTLTPETFNMASLGVGGNRNYYADPATRQSWAETTRNIKSGGSSWRNGQFGYEDYRNFGANSWQPYQNQPKAAPLFATNPAAYQRNQLADQYQTALDEAKAKTEERYQQALGNLEGVGQQEQADLNTRFDSSRSAVNQSLVSSGLSGTSVLPSMQRGVERERTGASNRLAAMLARERNQIIQSRNDIPPDLQLYSNLMFQQGAGGGRF